MDHSKFCKSCGNPITDGSRFCRKCGATLPGISEGRDGGVKDPVAPEAPSESGEKRRTVILALVGLGVVVVAALLGYLAFSDDSVPRHAGAPPVEDPSPPSDPPDERGPGGAGNGDGKGEPGNRGEPRPDPGGDDQRGPRKGSMPAYRERCGNRIYADGSASCAFARNIAAAYRSSPASTLYNIYSPVTKVEYTVECREGAFVTCTGGEAAVVYFYR